jgi:threonine dehydrogenase-like Zn-dependent dehydrogenase
MGPYNGGQAELLRVPYADFNLLVLPPDARDKERQKDYVMLSDIFPTGWHATRLACLTPGDTCVIYGSGPVGLMAAYSAQLQSASKVWVVDRHPDRLQLAERIGCTAIDYSKANPVDQIMEETGGKGADRGCECVGYQATDAQGNEHPNITLNNLVQSVKFAGTIGVVGVFIARDPSSPDQLYKQGEVAFDYGMFWSKGQTMGTGQCNVKNYNRALMALIAEGKARPSFVVSHELPLDAAPDGYQHFDKRDQGWTKVVMHPDASR